MATITVTIAGVDRTKNIYWDTFSKTEHITKDPDTVSFQVKNYPTKGNLPQLGDEVIVSYNAARIFGGHVISTDETIDGLVTYYTVICKDYSDLLDQFIVAKVYTSQTVTQILTDLITSFCAGLTANSIQSTLAGVTVPIFKCNYITVRQAIKNLIYIIGNYDYFVDYSSDFHFFNTSSMPAPFAITDTAGKYAWNSLDVKSDLSQLVNTILVRGAQRTSTTQTTEYFSGDGTTYIFPLSYNYPSAPGIKVGGVSQTVGNDGVDADTSFQSMWNATAQSIRFTSGNIPVAGTRNIVVQAFPQFPLLLEKTDDASIAKWGTYQKVIIDKNILDQTTASLKADAELLFYSQPIYTLMFKTYTDGLQKGQLLSFQSTYRNLNLSLNISEIVTTLHTPTQILEYQVTAITAPPIGINEVLNKLLVADPAAQVTIDQTELVERYRSFTEKMALAETISTPTNSSPPYLWGTAKWGFATWS